MNSYGWGYKHLVEYQTSMLGCENIKLKEEALDDDNFNYNLWAKDCMSSFKNVSELSDAKSWETKIKSTKPIYQSSFKGITKTSLSNNLLDEKFT